MFDKIRITLTAALLAGSATMAMADGYTDQAADAMRGYGPVVRSNGPSVRQAAPSAALTTRSVVLPTQPQQPPTNWMDRASQTESGGY